MSEAQLQKAFETWWLTDVPEEHRDFAKKLLDGYGQDYAAAPGVADAWRAWKAGAAAMQTTLATDAGAEFKWPTLPNLPESHFHVSGIAYFHEHQMQGYANAYGETVRAALQSVEQRMSDAAHLDTERLTFLINQDARVARSRDGDLWHVGRFEDADGDLEWVRLGPACDDPREAIDAARKAEIERGDES